MINYLNEEICTNLRNKFNQAKPYKYCVIDNFLKDSAADTLLNDFPAFNNKNSLNESGVPGPKSVINDIKSISKNYELFYSIINSEDFLTYVSSITGIENLISDPNMYGGGTHENIEGAELDCHIDFNLQQETNYHRRLNLLL
jgi:hypothetical protein